MQQVLKDNDRVRVETDGKFVIKYFKNIPKEQNKILLNKLERKDELKAIQGFVVPEDFEVKKGDVKEIYTKYINYPDFFTKQSFDASSGLSLEVISKCFENLNKTLRQGHEKNVIFLDFISDGNVKYNPKTFQTYIMDYEDCQIDKNPAFAWSLHLQNTKICHLPKYRNGIFFTKNADIFLLILRWFNMCTQMELNTLLMTPTQMLSMMNMNDPNIIRKTELCYVPFGSNEYFDDDFMRIFSDYKFEESSYDIGRAFVKK